VTNKKESKNNDILWKALLIIKAYLPLADPGIVPGGASNN
jgi:hypothetical protein